MSVSTAVNLCGFEMKNPVMTASGTFGFGYEMADWYDLNLLGGIAMKGTTANVRFGNPTPRIAECAGGLLNAVGLQNPGVAAVISEELPRLRKVYNGVVVANISGFSIDEYVYVAQVFNTVSSVNLLEVNISCPNVHGGGMAFGTDPASAAAVVEAVRRVVRKPVLVKLSPNAPDIVAVARACEAAGAQGLVVANTLLGTRIDPRTGRSVVSIGACGYSGPAIKPIILRMVGEVCAAVSVPVVGVGGIASAGDVLEYIWAGATAVQVGSQTLVDPCACQKIVEKLPALMEAYGIESLDAIRGMQDKPIQSAEETQNV